MNGGWLLLVLRLPGDNTAVRMRVWRRLKASGASALRDGVYLLPDREGGRDLFRTQVVEVEGAGGSGYVIPFAEADGADDLPHLFDRTDQYVAFLDKVEEWRAATASAVIEADAGRRGTQLRRELEAIVATDFFPSPAQAQAAAALAEAEAACDARFSSAEPHATTAALPARRAADYQGCTWATRRHPWVDRVASAWLIRRFVDPAANFVWLADLREAPREAVGFDYDGAAFTHVGERVTFEVLATSFALDGDPAVRRLAALVHYLDVGGVPVAEAAGFAAILAGARERGGDDDALLAAIAPVIDALYHHFTNAAP